MVEPALSAVFESEPIDVEIDDIQIDVNQFDIPVDMLLQDDLMDTDPLPDVQLFPDQVPMETVEVGDHNTIPMETTENHVDEQLLETSSEEEDDFDDVTGNS